MGPARIFSFKNEFGATGREIQLVLEQAIKTSNPRIALKGFIKAKRLNDISYPRLKLLTIFLPCIAVATAFAATRFLHINSTGASGVIALAFQLLIGYYPVFRLRAEVMKQTRYRYKANKDPHPKTTTLVGAFMVLISDYMAIFGILLFGCILSMPIIYIISKVYELAPENFNIWPRSIHNFIIGAIILLGSAVYLTNMPLFPYILPPNEYDALPSRRSKARWWIYSLTSLIAQVFAGWWHNRSLIMQSIANLIFMYWIFWMSRSILTTPLLVNVITGAFAGWLLSSVFNNIPDDPIFDEMVIVGRIICYVQLRRWYAAQEWIWTLTNYPGMRSEPMRNLASTIEIYKTATEIGWPKEYRDIFRIRAFESINKVGYGDWSGPFRYEDLWKGFVDRSKKLVLENQ